jgi:hypothetical protein
MLTRLALVAVAAGLAGPAVTTAAAAPVKRTTKKTTKAIAKPLTKPGAGNQTTLPACWIKTSDILDKRIDIGAQYSLMRKMGGTFEQRREASSMITAVKKGELAGILLPPRKAVSDRGQRMSPPTPYWEMIPKGQNAVCLKQPAGEPPMIVYRENMSDPNVDAALSDGWSQCGLRLLREPCGYEVDLVKPEEKKLECETHADCESKKIGNFCTDRNTCEYHFPDGGISGKPPTGERGKCYDEAKRTQRTKQKACEAEEFTSLARCTSSYLISEGKKPGDPSNKVKLAGCILKGALEKEKCKRAAYDEYEHQRKHVCPSKPA